MPVIKLTFMCECTVIVVLSESFISQVISMSYPAKILTNLICSFFH